MTLEITSQYSNTQPIEHPEKINPTPSKIIQSTVDETINFINLIKESYPNSLEHFKSLTSKVTTIQENSELTLMCARTEEDIQCIIDNHITEIHKLKNSDWVFGYKHLLKNLTQLKVRVDFLRDEFEGKHNFMGIETLDRYYENASEIIKKMEANFKESTSNDEKNIAFKSAQAEFKQAKKSLETGIAAFSILSTRNKMKQRIMNIFDKFPELSFTEEQKNIEEIVASTDKQLAATQSNTDKKKLINEALDQLQEVDMKIEKANAIREIQDTYNKLIITAKELEKEGINFSDEKRHASASISGKEELIKSINLVGSPTGIDSLLRLDITRKCTLKSLARTLKDIYIKYGEHTIKTTLDLLPFSSRLEVLDGIATEERTQMHQLCKRLLSEAKDELTYGEGGVPTQCPPLIKEEKMEEIINKHLKHTYQTIYLVYAELCIMKALKFYLLRKQFEGCDEDKKLQLNNSARIQIDDMTKKLKKLFRESKIKDMNETLGRKVENIISDYVIKIHELD
ncbi:MAG: hypothetical protein VX777_08900 [Chlamydiota bacterium]|nr:hypothetical protein [Chlamydiota bacterium]